MSYLDGPKLFLPIGPPGCGKTTLGQLLISAEVIDHHAIVSPDHFRAVLTGQRGDQSMNQVAFGICHRICEERMSRQLPVYFDSTNVRKNWRTDVVKHANEYRVPVVSILFDLPELVCRDRNRTFDRQRHGAIVPDEVMDLMFERYAELDRQNLPGTVVLSSALEPLLRHKAALIRAERSASEDGF